MGSWTLKDRKKLDPYQCLQLGEKDDLGNEYCDVTEIVDFDVRNGHEINEVDKEHVREQIKKGFQGGEINDWDDES